MKKEYIVPAFGVLFLLLGRVAFADVTISEIMYDPDGSDTNREWVEVYNDSGSSVDMTSWKFVEADTNHGLTGYSGGMTLGAGEYGIIALDAATFASEYSTSGPVFDASFSLINSGGETLSLKDSGGNIVFTVSYDPTLGANDDGNSLQKYNGSWAGADPTPGNSNSDSDTDGPADNTGGGTGDDSDSGDESDDSGDSGSSSGSSSSSGGGSTEEKKVQVNDEWQLTIYSDSYGIVGAPSLFTTEVENLWGSRVRPGRYVWNMGDGTTYDGKEYGEVWHTYEYPGDYVISIDYWRTGAFEKEVSVRHTFTVKATSMSIAGIVRSNGNLDAEIKNTSSSEVDLTGWSIVSSMRTYKIPAGTILLANKTLTLPSRSTHFTATEQMSLKLTAPDGGTVASSLPVVQAKTTTSYSATSNRTSSSSTSSRTKNSSSSSSDESEEDGNKLSADASRSGVRLEDNMWWLFGLGLIVLGVGATVYMRRETKNKDDDDDFEVSVVGE